MKRKRVVILIFTFLAFASLTIFALNNHQNNQTDEKLSTKPSEMLKSEKNNDVSDELIEGSLSLEQHKEDSAQKLGTGCVWAQPPVYSSEDLKPNLSAQILSELSKLKWQTNIDYKGMGSPDAKKGGTLKYVVSAYPPSLRTCGKNANSAFTSMLQSLCYESLLDMDPITYGYAPNLAEKWAISDDLQSFYFEIDENAKWSDGMPVCSNDLLQSWRLYTNPDIDDPFYNAFYSTYEEPLIITDRILMIKSKNLNWRAFMSAGFMTVLPGHIIGEISGKEYLKTYQHLMMPGSGAYTFLSSKTNEEIILSRRPDWWQIDYERNRGYCNFDRLQFVFLMDENLIKEKFKAGQIDWISVNVAREWHQEYVPALMPQIANGWIQKRKIFTHRPIGVSGLAYNIRKPPFNDVRVRKAIAHLYNREKMMDNLFFGEYEYLDSFYPNSPFENPDNPKIRYDPDKAVELLEEAGWLQKNRSRNGWLVKDGKVFDLTLNYTQQSTERILTIFQEDLKDVGIRLHLKQVTWATDIKEVGERFFTISSRAYTGILFPNPESSFHSKYADKPNNNNIWGFKNDRVDEILENYHLMFTQEERISAVREVDKIVSNEHLYAFGWYGPSTRLLYWNKFGMPDYYLSRTGDERGLVSLWWFDDDKADKLVEAMATKQKLEVGEEVIKWWDDNYPQHSGE